MNLKNITFRWKILHLHESFTFGLNFFEVVWILGKLQSTVWYQQRLSEADYTQIRYVMLSIRISTSKWITHNTIWYFNYNITACWASCSGPAWKCRCYRPDGQIHKLTKWIKNNTWNIEKLKFDIAVYSCR